MSEYVTFVGTTGPLFDGQAERIVVSGVNEIAKQMADKTVSDIQNRLDLVLRNPTGYYRLHISAAEESEGSYSVSDNDVVYGPWLEGVSSRNDRSVFKGYRTFEVIGNRLENEVESAVNDALDRVIERLVI